MDLKIDLLVWLLRLWFSAYRDEARDLRDGPVCGIARPDTDALEGWRDLHVIAVADAELHFVAVADHFHVLPVAAFLRRFPTNVWKRDRILRADR